MAVLSGRSAYPRSLSMITDIAAQGPFARKRHTRCSKHHHYSITSSARAISVGRISIPHAFAAFRLMTNWNVVGNWTGRSAGFAPFKIW